jgi:hypothetical protein
LSGGIVLGAELNRRQWRKRRSTDFADYTDSEHRFHLPRK